MALHGLEEHGAAFEHAAGARMLAERKLVIVEFRERDAFGIAIKLFVLLFVCHLQAVPETLRLSVKYTKRGADRVRAGLALVASDEQAIKLVEWKLNDVAYQLGAGS